jgi:C-terminal processing protease CtpA/Prc
MLLSAGRNVNDNDNATMFVQTALQRGFRVTGAVKQCTYRKPLLLAPKTEGQRVKARLLPLMTNSFGYNVFLDPEDRAKRALSDKDVYAVVQKPLGLTLAERDDGMVYIAAVDPAGNAAKTGVLRPGQVVTAVSATFGDEVWSVRGVGLDRVLKSIKVRSGNYVTIVVEDERTVEQKKADAYEMAQRRAEDARERFGEREVLDPVTWTSRRASTSEGSYQYDADMEREIANSVDEPFRQTWLLWALGGMVAIVAVLIFTFFT